jgi:maltooligosyltrehalose trehalohydrolase
MRRRHEMPFGAQVLETGEVRFNLWAPGVGSVELRIGEETRPMPAAEDGFFSLTLPAAPGADYLYRIGGQEVPDPASRYQPQDVHGPSRVVDPAAFDWRDGDWRGRPWEETVLYELHVGTFTPEGTFMGVESRLDYLAETGITAVELMPLSDFPGERNWGYDGVLPFAPESRYGTPEELKHLVQAAHERGLMVFLDVVYNHFGPEGNYLHLYAPQFFTERHRTPWGAAINFDGEWSRPVREFFVHNALYWLEEYHLDGLRFDAVHAIADDSGRHFLEELAGRVREELGGERHVHLVLENDANEARYLREDLYDAQWNDDIHHALHAVATGESGGYYADYADAPVRRLGRCLAEGFAYQGEPSVYRDGERRGEPSTELPPVRFVSFIQNHDQVGNRAFGDRLPDLAPPEAVRAVSAVYLFAPQIPMVFMGEEWAAERPFPFFCDFGPELAQAVTEGRRQEFARFPEFSDPETRERIPDPNDPETFRSAVLHRPEENEWLEHYRTLLRLRHEEVVPRLKGVSGGQAEYRTAGERGLRVRWTLGDGSALALAANLGPEPGSGFEASGRTLYALGEPGGPWSVAWYLEERESGVGSSE